MLVSTVSIIPAVRPIEKIKYKLEDFNRGILGNEKYNRLKEMLVSHFPTITRKINNDMPLESQVPLPNTDIPNRLKENNIRILGLENYTKLRTTLEDCFTNIQRKINTSVFSDFLSYWFDYLIEITITIFAFCYLLVGHNPVGDLLGILAYLIIMPIPIFLLSMMEACLYLPLAVSIMLLGTALDFEEIIYKFGLMGLCLVLCVLLPITITLGIVAIPLGSIIVFLKNYWFILSDACYILWD